jgi:hypothetical protein
MLQCLQHDLHPSRCSLCCYPFYQQYGLLLLLLYCTPLAAAEPRSITQQRQLLWPDSKANPAKPSAPKQMANMGDTAATEFARLGNRRLQQHAFDQPGQPTTAKQATAPINSASDELASLGKHLLAAASSTNQQRQLLWPDSKANPAKPSAPKQMANMGDTAATEFARLGNRRLQQHSADQAHPEQPIAPQQPTINTDSATEDFARLGKRRLVAASAIVQQRQLLWPDSKANPAKPSAPKQMANMGDSAAAEFARLGNRH